MRVLFAFGGNRGHLDPLLPIARAARRAGHVVAFGGRPWMVPKVEALGLDCFPGGTDDGLIPQRVPLEPRPPERDVKWSTRKPRLRAADLTATIVTWRPDLVVWEETDFGAGIAAEHAGLPHATVVVTAAGTFLRQATFGAAVAELRAEYGLPPGGGLDMFHRYLELVPVPPSFRDPSQPPAATAHPIRPATLDRSEPAARTSLPAWIHDLPRLPTVYLTLGTVFPLESGDLFERVIAAVRQLPVNLIVTVGDEFDLGELGGQPANVHVVRWLPQDELLPLCELVICHGGSGTVVASLARGIPLVVIPMGADQLDNAWRCEALGVGRVLDPIASPGPAIRDGVRNVLDDGAFRAAARRIEQECLALPGPDETVELLERLARERRPILR